MRQPIAQELTIRSVRSTDDSGINFYAQDALVGSVSSAGKWTFGNATIASPHVIQTAGIAQLVLKNSSSTGTSSRAVMYYMDADDTLLGYYGFNSSSNHNLYMYNLQAGSILFGTSATLAGSLSSSGLWTFGVSGTSLEHVTYGSHHFQFTNDTTYTSSGIGYGIRLTNSSTTISSTIGVDFRHNASSLAHSVMESELVATNNTKLILKTEYGGTIAPRLFVYGTGISLDGTNFVNALKNVYISNSNVSAGTNIASVGTTGTYINAIVVGAMAYVFGYLTFTTNGSANVDRYIVINLSSIRASNFTSSTNASGTVAAGYSTTEWPGSVYATSSSTNIYLRFLGALPANAVNVAARFCVGVQI